MLEVRVVNLGQQVASDVRCVVSTDVSPSQWNYEEIEESWEKVNPLVHTRECIFPGKAVSFHPIAVLDPAKIDEAKAMNRRMLAGNGVLREADMKFMVLIRGCVFYKSTTNSKAWHKTGFTAHYGEGILWGPPFEDMGIHVTPGHVGDYRIGHTVFWAR